MEPLKGGALIDIPEKAYGVFKRYNPDKTPAEWAFDFDLNLDNIIMILSGMNTLSQLHENIQIVDSSKPLTNRELYIIDKASRIIMDMCEIPCTYCMYCIDVCPEKIAIPKYFSLYNTQKLLSQAHSIGMYYRNYIAKGHTPPSNCIKCQKCIRICPQSLDIIKYLENITKTFEI